MRELLQQLLQMVWQTTDNSGEAGVESDVAQRPHPAGISRNWSMLYVWLQVRGRSLAHDRARADGGVETLARPARTRAVRAVV